MKKFILVTVLLFSVLLSPFIFATVGGGIVDVSSPLTGWGFQNGNYIYFRDAISVNVEQIASSNVTYGDWVFVQKVGSNDIYGFYSSGVNVTVNSFFVNDLLEFSGVGAGTVKVQVWTRDKPVLVSGATGIFDATNKIATVTLTSSGTVQLSWVTSTDGSDGVVPSDEETPVPTPIYTVNPSISPNAVGFNIDNIDLGTVEPNSTVSSSLHFTFSGSDVTLQTLTFPEPFKTWYLASGDISSVKYILQPNGEVSGTVQLAFQIPANVTEQHYSGSFSLTCIDAFGAIKTSSATISCDVGEKLTGIQGLIAALKPYWLLIVLAVIFVIAVLVILSRKRR